MSMGGNLSKNFSTYLNHWKGPIKRKEKKIFFLSLFTDRFLHTQFFMLQWNTERKLLKQNE